MVGSIFFIISTTSLAVGLLRGSIESMDFRSGSIFGSTFTF